MVRRVMNRLRRVIGRTAAGPAEVEPALVLSPPSPQNALDAFRGEWISAMPPELGPLEAGQMPLFQDPRVAWALERLGGVAGQRVLELGPMEAGHTYMLERAGAREILAIEGNRRCFLKCLVVKEVARLRAARFELGNFVEYLRTSTDRFDLCLASGVLYHMANPLELVHLLARVTDRAYLWTHYFDRDRVMATVSAPHFSGSSRLEYAGFSCVGHRYEYFSDSRIARYAGGLQTHSHWLGREDLLAALAHAGFDRVEIAFEEIDHVHGPCLALAARRTHGAQTTARPPA